jgi:two-component system NarL family response regulator
VLSDLRDQGDRNREFEALMRLLTPRERDVLACMVSGLDRASVARELGLSVDTVRTHTQNMFAKLHVHSVLEAVGLAVRAGVGSSRSGESRLPVSRGREA